MNYASERARLDARQDYIDMQQEILTARGEKCRAQVLGNDFDLAFPPIAPEPMQTYEGWAAVERDEGWVECLALTGLTPNTKQTVELVCRRHPKYRVVPVRLVPA